MSRILSTGRGVCPSACWDTHPHGLTPPDQTPPGQTTPLQCMLGCTPPDRHLTWQAPPGRHPLGRYPPGQTPSPGRYHPGQTPPGQTAPSPPHDSHCSGRYASYWDAFLFGFKIRPNRPKTKILIFKLPNFKLTDSQSGVITISPKKSTPRGVHRKELSDHQSLFIGSSLIHLILLIKLIQYKIGKT